MFTKQQVKSGKTSRRDNYHEDFVEVIQPFDEADTDENSRRSLPPQRTGYMADNEVLYGYIPDYYFPQYNKIVELDGRQFHDAERDKARDAAFHAYGIQTFRIRSYRVFTDLTQVLRSIDIFLGEPGSQKDQTHQKEEGRKGEKEESHPACA